MFSVLSQGLKSNRLHRLSPRISGIFKYGVFPSGQPSRRVCSSSPVSLRLRSLRITGRRTSFTTFLASGIPILDRYLKRVAEDRHLAHSSRWSHTLKSLVAELSNILLAESYQRPVRKVVAPMNINSLPFLDSTTLQRREVILVSFQELTERRGVKDLRVRRHAEMIDLRLEIARPLFRLGLAVEALGPWLHSATAHLGLPASSKFSDRCHLNLRL